MKLKKLLAVMLAGTMLLGSMAGCGQKAESEDKGDAKTEGNADEGKDSEGKTISVAAIETAYGSEMWTKVAEAFTEETGINVELTTDKKLEDVIGHLCRVENIQMLFIWLQDVRQLLQNSLLKIT